ncbi:ZIP family metal transporter [Novosphingobium sp. UBA1939]|uniref:ZIP family metal transporter n=1 Tax=Novosphingobium sp. UBA1939 TaxID=1946982 RepID=UPI0025DE83AC|nr:ZIP family metal transporter [Novosphingobium sp. UBA1939]
MSAWLPYGLGLAASFSTYVGGLLALRFGTRRDLLLGLTGGMVVGLALLDLLPEALEHGAGTVSGQTIFLTAAAGLCLYLLMHRLPAGGTASRMTLIAHSLMDGLGIGLAFQLSEATGWLVAVAVLAHDMADGANMVGLTALFSRPHSSHRWLLVNATAPLIGVAVGQAMQIDMARFALLLALFAGGFLYIGASELLPRSRAGDGGYAGAAASLLGISVMAFVVHFAG